MVNISKKRSSILHDKGERFCVFRRLNRFYIFDSEFTRVARLSNFKSPNKLIRQLTEYPQRWDDMFPDSTKMLRRFAAHDKSHPHFSILELIVSNACNMRCRYCFTGHGGYWQIKNNSQMSRTIARGAIDLFLNKLFRGRVATIFFFGGEPLTNWDTIKYVLEYASALAKKKKIEIRFVLDTNGTRFTNSIIDTLDKFNVRGLISIDSYRSRVHNMLRPYQSGSGSFEDIMKAIEEYPKITQILTPRSTVTKFNTELFEYVKYYHSLGFKDVIFGPVLCQDSKYSLTAPIMKKIDNEFEKILRWNIKMMDRVGSIHEYGLSADSYEFFEEERLKICDGGYRRLCAVHNGNLYSCGYLAYDENHRIGDLSNGIDKDKIVKYIKRGCAPNFCPNPLCWAKRYCGEHGCVVVNRWIGNDKRKLNTYCSWIRSKMENAMVLEYEIQRRFPS